RFEAANPEGGRLTMHTLGKTARTTASLAGATALMLSLTTPPARAETPYNWSGPYLGFHAGKGWGRWDGNMVYTDAALVPAEPFGAFDDSSHTINSSSAIGGGQVGWNIQSGAIVWGIEADGSWAHFEGDTVMFPYPDDPNRGTAVGTPAWSFGVENNWLAT